MKKAYTIFGVITVCVWVVMLGMLVRDKALVDASSQFETDFMHEAIRSREEWAGIYLADAKIGYVHTALERIEEGFRLTESMHLDMTVMGVPQNVATFINAVTDRDLALSLFSIQLKSGVISFSAYGTVQDTTITMWVQTAGKRQRKVITLDEAPVLANNVKHYLLKKGLVKGATHTQTFFDPLTMSSSTMTMHVEGRQEVEVQGVAQQCWKVRIAFAGGTLYAWINEQGETVREESAMGLVMLKEDRGTARGGGGGERPDIATMTSIQPDRQFSKAGLSLLAVRLKNVALEGLTLDGGRQSLDGDVVTVRLEKLTDRHTHRLPFSGAGLDEHLAPTLWIQSDHPEIKDLADAVCGDNDDARSCAAQLISWVHTNISKQPTMSVPNALEVLATRQGDCNEHAVLLAALCRARGIPARIIAGIVYMNGSFYYHAWNEVFLHEWISADATLDQFPADVTHIKCIDGEYAHQIAMLRLVGELAIDVVRYQ